MSELPDGWINTSLGTLVNMKYGKGLKKALRQGSGYSVYGSNGVVGSHNEAITNGPSIIIGRKGSIGEVHLSEDPCWPIDTTYFIDDLKEMPLRYWYYYLKSLPLSLLNKATAIPGISRADVYKLTVNLPPVNEQQTITEKLDQVLRGIGSANDQLNQVPDILKNFRSSILAYASSGKLTQDWRRENNVTLETWENRSGQDIFPFITSGSRGWAKYYSEDGPIFLRVGNLDHQTINLDLSSLQHVMPPEGAEGQRTRIEHGDILISITADVGMVALISEDIDEAYINQHLCLARQSGEYNGQYLAYYLASPLGGLSQFTSMQKGVTKAGITLGDIRDVLIKVPCLDEQQEIVNRVERLMMLADQIEEKYHCARDMVNKATQSVFDKAFRGELVPQNQNDESADILLKKIERRKILIAEREKNGRKKKVSSRDAAIEEIVMPLKNNTNISPSYLSKILQKEGALTAEKLWEYSKLDIDMFYDQLKEEESMNFLREEKGNSVDDERLLILI